MLTEPKNALTKQYAGIFSKNDCKFHITEVRGCACVCGRWGGRRHTTALGVGVLCV